MNNRVLARCLRRIADLYAVDGANPFKVRAIGQAAEEIAACPFSVSAHPEQAGRLPGVGSSTVELIRQIIALGPAAVMEQLPISIPSSLGEVLTVPGLGPKTVRLLYEQAGIRTLSDVKRALENGELRKISGFGAKRVEQLRREMKQMEQRERTIPIALAWPAASAIAATIRQLPGVTEAQVTGAARRLVTQVDRLEIVVGASNVNRLHAWASQFDALESGVERTAKRQLDAMLVDEDQRKWPSRIFIADPDRFAYRWMESTGDAVHQEIVARMALERGCQWIASGLVCADGAAIHCKTEREIYDRLGLPYYPPELREGQGLLQHPDRLIHMSDIRGDLHTHSAYSDGSVAIVDMAVAARERGYEYMAVTDHSQSLSIAGGLSPADVRRQAEEIERANAGLDGITILRGIEVDILSDGTLDLPDDLLWDLDIVVASIHSGMHQSTGQLTKRIVRAMEHPAVDIIGHLSGRLIGRREPYLLDLDPIFAAAKRQGVSIELNANPNRLDAAEDVLRRAAAEGVTVAVNTDAHAIVELNHMSFGVRMAVRGWLKPAQVLNTATLGELRQKLHKSRNGSCSKTFE